MKVALSRTWLFTAALLASGLVYGQEKPASAPVEKKPPAMQASAEEGPAGFVDQDKDGINDRFVDADGDGNNDVDGKAYPHSFRFEDKNKDGINDLWRDRDGDGVNDLGAKLDREQQLEARSNVLDEDGDGRNDITGDKYDAAEHHWMGERWGFWNESTGKLQGRFIDEDGNGIDDRIQDSNGPRMMGRHGRMRDVFIDEDGDGICDGRGDVIHRMGRMHRGGRRGGKQSP